MKPSSATHLLADRALTFAALPLGIAYTRRPAKPPADWQARLLKRLRSFAQFAYDRTPFYRDQWQAVSIDPRTLRSLADFAHLPIIPRLTWRSAPDAAIVPAGAGPLWWRQTGGSSTGTPLMVSYTLADELQMRGRMIASTLRETRWLRGHVLRFQPPDLSKSGGSMYLNRVMSVASQASPDQALEALIRFPTPTIISYPSPLWRAVMLAHRRQIALTPRRYIQVGGEMMTDSMRRTLMRGLAGWVRQVYAASDFGGMAVECREGRLHIAPESTYIELYDGDRAVGAGEWGEVIVTNFISHGRPLIRVRTGDRAMWGADPCPCGSPLPHLAYVAGRLEDCIIRPDQQRIVWPDVEQALTKFQTEVFGYQISQTQPDHITARLSLADTAPISAIEDCLHALFAGMSIDFLLTDDLPASANRKTKSIIGLAEAAGSKG